MKTKRKNIFKSLLALTLALIMVLGVAPISELAGVDWASLFAPKAEATKSEILNYDLMEAEYITGKRSYPSSAHFSGNTANDVYRQYAKDDLYSPTVSMLDSIESDKTLSALLTTWKAYSLGGSPSSATGLIMDGVDYCETLLAMALKKTLSETAVTTVLKSEVLGDSKDLKEMFDSFCDTSESLDLSKDSEKIQSSLKKAVKDLYKDTPSKASKVEGAIGDFIKYSKNIVELCQKVATYSKMLDLDDFTKEWLNRMYEANEINGNDSDMRIALNNLIVASSGDSGFSDLSWARAGFTGVEWIVQKGIDEGIKILCRSNPVVAAIFAGLSIGSTICNLFFATDDICEQLYVMQKFEILQNIARSAMMKCQSGFELVRDIKSAQIFNKAVEMYFHIITDVDCDCMSEFLTKLYTGGYLKDITVKIKGASGDYESCTNAVEDLRNVRRNNYNYIITYCKGGFKLESEESYSYYFGEKSTEIPVESISLRQNNIEINMDGFLNLFPQYTPSDTTQKGVIYTSSDESIIPSGNTGILFPKKAGKVTITLTSIYDSSIKTSVTVTVTDSESPGDETEGTEFSYEISNGKVTITGTTTKVQSKISIPASIDGLPVTSIGEGAFFDCENLKTVLLPETIESIEKGAFYNCTNLQDINFPSQLKNIGKAAFYNCSLLTFDNSWKVDNIGELAFYNCDSIEKISLNQAGFIGEGAFANCDSLEIVESSYSKYLNGGKNFYCPSITLSDALTVVDHMGYYGWPYLVSATIPKSVETIGMAVFEYSHINHIFYTGTENDWNRIRIFNDNQEIEKATKHFNAELKNNVHISESVHPTCNSFGSEKVLCSICDKAIVTLTLPSIGHIGKKVREVNWCTLHEGYTVYYCLICGEYYKDDFVEPRGHKFNNERCTYCGTPEYLTYFLNSNNEIVINGLNYKKSDVFIPDIIEGYQVKHISKSGFAGDTYLTNITIPQKICEIKEGTFKGCTSLKAVKLPNGITDIGNDAFNGCSSLSDITIPDNVATIGDRAFNGCSSLSDITIPDNVATIGDNAFNGCISLVKVEIPNDIKRVGGCAFSKCTGLIDVLVPDTCTSIGKDTFSECERLECITIKKVNGEIKNNFFKESGATSVKKIIIEPGITYIGSQIFEDSINLESVSIPDSAKISINSFACKNIGCVIVTKDTGTIPYQFLASLLGNSSGYSVEKLIIEEGITKLDSYALDKCVFSNISLPKSISSIGKGALEYCIKLSAVVIPDGVINIGDSAFNGCTGLTSVVIPDSVTSVGNCAFSGCTGLTSVVIPDGVINIGDSAFNGCTGLTSVVIPDSVTSVGISAFNGCTGLTSVVIPDSVTSVGNYAFSGCTGLTSVVIPDSVTSVGDYAFYGCTGIKKAEIHSSILGQGAFNQCGNLTDVIIGKNATEMGWRAFDDCPELSNVYYMGDADGWNTIIFNGYASNPLTTANNLYIDGTLVGDIIISGKTSKINAYSFFNTSLRHVTICDGVKSIEKDAFYNCAELENIAIPESVVSIDATAFDECNSLTDVYYSGTKEQWDAINFIGYYVGRLSDATIHYNCESCAHAWDRYETIIAPTVDSEGLEKRVCSKCGADETRVIPKLDPCTHNWSSWKTVTEPTLDSEGLEKRVCSKCGAEETRAISKLEPVQVTSIKLNKSKKSLNIGDTFTLTVTVKPNDATDKSVTWSSSDTSVATVDENGVVTAVAEGTATITATASNGVEASCTVTVKQKGDSIFKKILNIILAPFRAIINLFKKLFGK